MIFKKLVTTAGFAIAMLANAHAVPYIPANGNEVLEHLPSRNDPAQREIKGLRAQLAANPQDLDVAIELSRRYISAWRDGGDPRYLGYAQAALGPWWTLARPPLAALVMRATLLQSTHQFPAALADLDAVVKEDPDNAQAWLTRATVLQVLGDYAQARSSCERLNMRAPSLIVATCLASVDSVTGHAQQSYEQLATTLKASGSSDPDIRIWVSTLLAEMAVRRGDVAGAQKQFSEAFAAGTPDNYLLAAYADFLLDQHQPAKVVELLKSKTQIDSLLLRYALALKASGSQDTSKYIDMLTQRFTAATMRGDTIHQREQARYELELMDHPAQALIVAQQNWRIQKEPADTLLLLKSAAAAKDKAAAGPVIDWVAKSRLEDQAIVTLVHGLQR